MIDIHCHILPDIDDGPKSIDESVRMLKAAKENGIKKICATPHLMKGAYTEDIEKIKRAYESLKPKAAEEGIELYLGAEVYFDLNLINEAKEKKIFTVNSSKYVLLEFPMTGLPPAMNEILFELQINNYIPVISHPERNIDIIMDPNIMFEIVYKGALVQQNSGSLLGEFGSKTARVSRLLLEANLVHIIASDAHGAESRGFNISKWKKKAAAFLPPGDIKALTEEIPGMIINNVDFEAAEPRKVREKSMLDSVKEWFTQTVDDDNQ